MGWRLYYGCRPLPYFSGETYKFAKDFFHKHTTMVYEYRPEGVCSKLFKIDVDDDGIVRHAEVLGGCHGNLQGICRLIEGRPAEEVAATLSGIRCGMKPTSCPDQISKALTQIASQAGEDKRTV